MDPISSKKTPLVLAQADTSVLPTSGSFPKKIPEDWIHQVKGILDDPCFCVAVMSVLVDYSEKMKTKSFDAKYFKMAFQKTKEAVSASKWGPVEGLKDKNGKRVDGLFKEGNNHRFDEILIERNLFTVFGDAPNNDIPDQSHRLVSFSHEAVHKLLLELRGRAKLSEEEEVLEQSLVVRILIRYFNGLPHQNQKGLMESLLPDISKEIDRMRASCKEMGLCVRDQPKQMGDDVMDPSLVPPVPHGADYNNDGIPDSFAPVLRGEQVETPAGHEYSVGLGPETPVLRGPPPNWIGFRLDEYQECPVETKPGTKVWQLHYSGRFDRYEFPFTRFNNSKKTMSFAPGEKVFIPTEKEPQEIHSIVLYLSENDGDLIVPVYAQLQGCLFVPLDELSLATEQAERLDMEKVEKMLTLGALIPNSSPAEWRVSNVLQDILAYHQVSFTEARKLSENDRDRAFFDLRDKVLPQIRETSKKEAIFPPAWEEGAFRLLGLPPNESLQSACLMPPDCCRPKP